MQREVSTNRLYYVLKDYGIRGRPPEPASSDLHETSQLSRSRVDIAIIATEARIGGPVSLPDSTGRRPHLTVEERNQAFKAHLHWPPRTAWLCSVITPADEPPTAAA